MKTFVPSPLLCFSAAMLSVSSLHAVTFVLGDAFPSDGSGDINNPSSGTNGTPGNVVESVYRVSDGVFGNPFNQGNPGGGFSPLVVGDIFGIDYRTTIAFDLSTLPPAPIGQTYSITSIDLFLEVSSTDEVDNFSVDVDVFANTGVTVGALTQTPDSTFTVTTNDPNGQFIAAIPLSTGTLDLNSNNSEFLVTLDVADVNDGIRFGSSLSDASAPNAGINGTTFVEVAPRLRIVAELVNVPEPTTLTLFSMFSLYGISRRKRS